MFLVSTCAAKCSLLVRGYIFLPVLSLSAALLLSLHLLYLFQRNQKLKYRMFWCTLMHNGVFLSLDLGKIKVYKRCTNKWSPHTPLRCSELLFLTEISVSATTNSSFPFFPDDVKLPLLPHFSHYNISAFPLFVGILMYFNHDHKPSVDLLKPNT